jgi:hypothetical protein
MYFSHLQSHDKQIRASLLEFVRHQYASVPDTLFFEEFALHGGESRADLAALNGVLHGYEIKSSCDTLERLPKQVNAYCSVFERATLVGAACHLKQARSVVPAWWGIIEARGTESGVQLSQVRRPRPNPAPNPAAVAGLLWRQEALEILSLLGLDAGVRSKPMYDLIDRLAATVEPGRLSELVRQALRARGDWRVAARRKQCGDKSQQPASWWDSRRTLYGNKPR